MGFRILAFVVLIIMTLFAGANHFKLNKKRNEYNRKKHKQHIDTLEVKTDSLTNRYE